MYIYSCTASYALRGFSGNTSFHLDSVFSALFGNMSDFDPYLDAYDVCTGNETKLSECMYPGVGGQNCRRSIGEAGVICTGEY